MFHFFHSEFADKIFEPRFEIVRRFKAALLSRVDVTEINRRNKTFIHLAKRRYFLDSSDLRRFSHRFGTKNHIVKRIFINKIAQNFYPVESFAYGFFARRLSLRGGMKYDSPALHQFHHLRT